MAEQGQGDVELAFSSKLPLEQLKQAARTAGVEAAKPTTDASFGRQLQLRTPDGLPHGHRAGSEPVHLGAAVKQTR